MSDLLKITKIEGRVLVLRLEGVLDRQTEALITEEAKKAHDAGARYLCFDLNGLEFIASAGLRALHGVYKTFTPKEEADLWQKSNPEDVYKTPYFKIANASSNIYYTLSVSGFLHNIQIFPTLEEALKSFEGAG